MSLFKDPEAMESTILKYERQLDILTEQRDNHLNRLLREREEREREIELLRGLLHDYRSALAAERGGGTPLSREAYIKLHTLGREVLDRAAARKKQARALVVTGVRDDPST